MKLEKVKNKVGLMKKNSIEPEISMYIIQNALSWAILLCPVIGLV